MKTNFTPLLLVAAGCLGSFLARVSAQAPAKPSVAETSKIFFENNRTRVMEYRSGAGKDVGGPGLHSHPPHVFIMLTDAKIRGVTPEGKETFEDAKAGEAVWEPTVTHRAENPAGNHAGVYVIEFKDNDWKPSTDLSP